MSTEHVSWIRRMKFRMLGLPAQWTPQDCAAHWRYHTLSSSKEQCSPLRLGNTLQIERTRPQEAVALFASGFVVSVIALVPLILGTCLLLSLKTALIGVFLLISGMLLAALVPSIVSLALGTRWYDRHFFPPGLVLTPAAPSLGSPVRVHYSHLPREPCSLQSGSFALSELVLARYSQLPADGFSSPDEFQVLWSSGMQTHGGAASAEGMTLTRTVELPTGWPPSGALPPEAGELRREAIWYFRIREVRSPGALCDYEFILPVYNAY